MTRAWLAERAGSRGVVDVAAGEIGERTEVALWHPRTSEGLLGGAGVRRKGRGRAVAEADVGEQGGTADRRLVEKVHVRLAVAVEAAAGELQLEVADAAGEGHGGARRERAHPVIGGVARIHGDLLEALIVVEAFGARDCQLVIRGLDRDAPGRRRGHGRRVGGRRRRRRRVGGRERWRGRERGTAPAHR